MILPFSPMKSRRGVDILVVDLFDAGDGEAAEARA